MRSLLRSSFLAVVLAGIFSIVSAAAPKASDSEPDFKALHAKVDAAWSSLKAENAAPYYAHDAGLVFYDATPLKYDGWAAYRDGAQKLFLDGATSMTFKVNDDLKVTRRGNIAWTTRTLHLSAAMKEGKPIEIDARDTVIWEKRGGRWLIVHEHVSAPLP